MKLRRRLRYNRKRTFTFIFLFLIVLGITLGYAFLTTSLNVNGALEVSSSSWDIHFANIIEDQNGVEATTSPTVSNNTTITFAVDLEKATDFYSFTADIINDGTYDAKIDTITISPTLTTEQQNYFKYEVTYSDGTQIQTNDALDSGTSETIKVYLEYKENSDTSLYPEEDEELEFSVTITYVQGKGTEVAHPITVYTANIYDGNDSSLVWIGQAIPNGITTYQTPTQAMAALKQATGGTTDSPFFLKHTVVNNIVTESYVGFVITPEMATANPGMTAGTYYLKGKKTWELVGGNWQCMSQYDDGNGGCIDPEYNTNKATLLSAFGSSYCTDSSSEFDCRVSGLHARADSDGYVDASCRVNSTGYSECSGIG